MRIEITSLADLVATLRVTDEQTGDAVEVSCGAGSGAHAALRLMVRNAARALIEKKTDRELRAFSGRGPVR